MALVLTAQFFAVIAIHAAFSAYCTSFNTGWVGGITAMIAMKAIKLVMK